MPMATESSSCILAPISIGELIDKITILEIKCTNLRGDALSNTQKELELLQGCLNASGICAKPELIRELKEVNQELWRIEDRIREQESQQDFGKLFISLARAVYKTNDRRSAIKKSINLECGSPIVEEKSYSNYQ